METTHTIFVFTENVVGLLNRITIIFTRRNINIESIIASESEVPGIYRYTIVVTAAKERIDMIVKLIEKQVDVMKAFYLVNDEIISTEIALYKISSEAIKQNELFIKTINKHNATIIRLSYEYIVVQKTGGEKKIMALFNELEQFGILEFSRSGKVSVTQSMETLTTYLKEIDCSNSQLES